MDKNTKIGLALMVAVLFAFSFLSRPSQEEIEARLRADSLAAVQQQRTEALAAEDSLRLAEATLHQQVGKADTTALFYSALEGKEENIVLENSRMALTVSNRGARVSKVVLKDYKDQEKNPLTLFDSSDGLTNFELNTPQGVVATAIYYFRPVQVTDSSVVMRLNADADSYIDFCYTLPKDDYMVDFSMRAVGMTALLSPTSDHVSILWKQKLRQLERGYTYENRYSNLSYKTADDYDYLSETQNEDTEVSENVRWVAFKNQFFSSVLIADKSGFSATRLTSRMEDENSGHLKNLTADLQASFDPTGAQATHLRYYFGPNHYKTLRAYDKNLSGSDKLELDRLVYLGWVLFRWINKYFTINLFDWLSRLGLGMGIVLLLMTVIVKGLVYPLTYKSYMSSVRMRVLKPQIDALNEKYPRKEDAMKKQQEMMSIYSKYGVSPMGGCLPMLLQMPIWIALFMFVPTAIELRQQSFLWADDLSTYDDIISWGVHIPFLGNHLSLFCLLMTVTNLLYTKYNLDQQKDTMAGQQQMPAMKWMMYLMPVIFIFVLNDYASGLNYYYFLSSVTSIVIMLILRRVIKDEKVLAQLKEYAATAKPSKKSNLMARLEEMQRQQEELQRRRQDIGKKR